MRSFAQGRQPTKSTSAVELRLETQSHAESTLKREILRADALLDIGIRLLSLVESPKSWYNGVVHAAAIGPPQGDEGFQVTTTLAADLSQKQEIDRNLSPSHLVPCYCTCSIFRAMVMTAGMASSVTFLLFILSTLGFMPALGRSTAPSARNGVALEQTVGQHSDVSSPLSPQHIFYTNSQKNFSWDDPALQRRLWSGQPERAPQGLKSTPTEKRHLQKRAPRILGTLIKIPSCLGCAPVQYNGRVGSIDQLTVMFLESVQLTTPAQLLNSCLFYTGILQDEEDQDAAAKLVPFFRKKPSTLSMTATNYGCKQNPRLYSIWNVYSAGDDKMASSNDPRQWNYWVAMEPGTWLYEGLHIQGLAMGLDKQVRIREYFENLSVAFANNCGGTIRVMSLSPDKLPKYGYIWGTKELPALRAKINSPGSNGVTNLIAIDAVDMTKQYMIDWNTLEATRILAKDDPLYYDPAQLDYEPAQLGRRDTCDQNTAYELDGQDWFG
ncbi:hypothetical protein F5Y19DRAFT_476233 [Xylariaceae sp. FL1651]|nr:hypothetical protein F5Y19DRAFT_476233 [Xylariaceae sp. FL1651]